MDAPAESVCILVSQLKAYQPPLSVVEPGTAPVGAKWAVFGFLYGKLELNLHGSRYKFLFF